MPRRVSLGLGFLVIAQAFAQSPQELFTAGRYREVVQAATGKPEALAVLIQARLELESPPRADLLELIQANLDTAANRRGKESPEYGEALLLLAEAHRQQPTANPTDEFETVRRLCAGHATFTCEAEAMRAQSAILGNRSQYAEAQKLGKAAWDLHRSRLGADAPLTARALANYAETFNFTDPTRCRDLADGAIDILRKTVSPDHPYLAYALNVRGIAARHLGDFPTAQRMFEETIRIREAVYGPDHRILMAPCNNLGLTEKQLGDFENARKYLSRTVRIGEQRLGADHPATVQALGNLAIVQDEEGDKVGALRLKEQVTEIERRRAPETMTLASNLHSLGIALREVGDYPAARTRIEESLAMTVRIAGEGNPKAVEALISLAFVDSDRNDHAAAEQEATKALELSRRHLGPDHPTISRALRIRAEALLALGRADEARRDLLEARTRETAGAPKFVSLAEIHRLLAQVALVQHRWDEADQSSGEAIRLLTALHDPDLPELAPLWGYKAKAQSALGKHREALDSALECERIGRTSQTILARGLTERNAILATRRRSTGPEILTTLATHEPSAVAVAWDAVIRNRSLVLDAVAERGRFVRSSESSAVRRQAQDLAVKRSELAKAVVSGRRALSAPEYAKRLEHLQAEAEKAELALADLSAAFRDQRLESRAGLEDVQKNLPPRSALVGFERNEDHFAAYITRDPGDPPTAIDLGPASRIDALVRAWHAEITRELESSGRSQKINEQRSRTAGEALRAAIWDPLAPSFKGADRVFLVPDGALATINFAALPVAGGKYLLETGPLLHTLSTERDLLRQPRGNGAGFLAVSNPAFSSTTQATSARRDADAPCPELNAMQFASLPGAAAEAQAVLAAWDPSLGPGKVLTGAAATESMVKQLAAGRRVLHFATHAFFVRKSCGAGTIADQNPLLRAGIALAGANARPSAGEDGILTAAEISQLDLDGVEWAVLSGCNTGTGDVLAGEGVLGLRRAFQTAGARSIIASLWPVDDQETRLWMTALYTAHFLRKRDTAESVRAAQIARLTARRAAQQSTHPFYWAGFIAVGDWR